MFAKESALEGLYYVRAARTAMGMDPGPELESLSGQKSAGVVTEDRRVDFEGRQIEASPNPTERTPNYYPGGRVAGRPVPAGWYSEPWWKPALVAGAWGLGSVLLFDAMFSGMHGVDYGAQGFENGYGDGYSDGFDAGQDAGDDGGGDIGDRGRRWLGWRQLGGATGRWRWGGDSWGGGDFGAARLRALTLGGGDFGGCLTPTSGRPDTRTGCAPPAPLCALRCRTPDTVHPPAGRPTSADARAGTTADHGHPPDRP